MPKAASKKKSAPTKKPTAKKRPSQPPKRTKLPSVWGLSKRAVMMLWSRRWLFVLIVLVYGIVNLAVAQGFSSGVNVSSTKTQLASLFHGHFSQLSSGITIYALMLASVGGSSSGSGSGFGVSLFLTVIASLALIWALRNTANNVKVSLRDAYYRGIYPLVPFLGIFLVMALELLPMVAGITIFTVALNNQIAITVLEKLGFVVLMVALSAVSFYWLISSVFALYIVTLPEMTPFKALRSARDLVRKRRLPILLRLLYLPLALLIVSVAIMLPIIILIPVVAPWVFLVLSLVMLALLHSYLYSFYRELIA